eukprot:CAMPEP_0115391098 /NCGR_PEP_ID=MMETSP0271-20121206/10539_1 /TAXON_ID=71861 /ORGANISM="Scrippsiella trochoidea, Strain CCMP3099" /LENGTH=104 /DNA_ID=CAMNT_0002814655 /DNA_START=261 /DNA_END=575 /DNA_ORIENTATION=+
MAEAVVANAEVDARPIHAPNVFGDEAVLLPLSDAAAGSVVVAHRVHKVEGASIEHPDIDPWAPRERIAALSHAHGPHVATHKLAAPERLLHVLQELREVPGLLC